MVFFCEDCCCGDDKMNLLLCSSCNLSFCSKCVDNGCLRRSGRFIPGAEEALSPEEAYCPACRERQPKATAKKR